MTTAKNTSTPTTLALIDGATLLANTKAAVTALGVAEARSRKALATMVATLVHMGEGYMDKPNVTSTLDGEIARHGMKPVKLTGNEDPSKPIPNIFLPLVRLADGFWEPVLSRGKPKLDQHGKEVKKYVWNRSYEKYASVIQFFIFNDISHEEVINILTNDDLIEVAGVKGGVQPTIKAIVAANAVQQNPDGRVRTVWTEEARGAAAALQPLAVVPLTEDLSKAIKFSEDGYAAVFVRKTAKGGLQILGDTGLIDNSLLGMLKRATSGLMTAHKAKVISKVSK